MSDRPEQNADQQPETKGGWREPASPQIWQEVKPASAQPAWRVPALPQEMPDKPQDQGGWHLPAPSDTTYQPSDEVEVRPKKTTPTTGTAATVAPEDLIAEILQQRRSTQAPTPSQTAPEADYAPAPEDFDFTGGQTRREPATRPEDMTFGDVSPADDAAFDATDYDPADLSDGMSGLAELGADDDDDAFSLSELIALQSLDDGSETGPNAAADLSEFEPDDLSPAQRALLTGQTSTGQGAPVPQPGESAAEFAARMAQQVQQEAQQEAAFDQTGAAQPTGQQATGIQQQPGESAADYARRMAQQYATSQYDTPAPTQTEPYSPSQQQPVQQQLSAAEQQLQQRFMETERQVRLLRDMYNNGQISYDDLQARMREYTILDDNQNWWMVGIETDNWYRYDNASGQWVEDEPPVPLTAQGGADPRLTETGQLNPDDVIAGSLPYLPQESQPDEYSSSQDPYQTAQAGYAYEDTPLPRPNQPMRDDQATVVGAAAYTDTLPGADPTVQRMPAVGQETMPSQSTIPSASTASNVGAMVERAQPYDEYAPDYSLDEVPESDAAKQARTQQRSRLGLYIGIAVVLLFGCMAVTGVGGLVAANQWYEGIVDPYRGEIAGLANYEPEFQTARIFDAEGNLIVELSSQEGGARDQVALEQISPFLIHAILSVENSTFYDDPGVAPTRIIQAFIDNLTSGEIVSGASTITQQITRNLILQDTSQTAERKLTEALVSMEIAETYSKNEILELYLNEFFFGNQSYGVEAAAQFYFDKSAADLNMAEAAMLAGLLSAPVANDPVVNKDAAIRSMRNAIRLMLDTNCLDFQHGRWANNNEQFCINESTTVRLDDGTEARLVRVNDDGTYGGLLALQLAQVETRQYLPREALLEYPHFVNYVLAQVEQAYGTNAHFQRGFSIYTTLIPRIQTTAEDQLRERVNVLGSRGVTTGAVMATDPESGAIRALVGSPDFNNEDIDGQVDNTRTWQQAGSTIKPILYTAALEGGAPVGTPNYLTPASILWDVPSSYDVGGTTYTPVNFQTGTYYGPVPVREALQNSYNVSAVKAYEFIGAQRYQETANEMGINFLPETQFGLAAALGANDVRLIDMMKAYGTLANQGNYVPLFAIERITETVDGQTLDVPLTPLRTETEQRVIASQVAFLMQNMLSDDAARAAYFGTNTDLTLARMGIPTQNFVAAKTGTTNDGRDLWTIGFTDNAVVGVWLGTFDNSPTIDLTGFTAAAPVWNRVMSEFITGRPPQQFEVPAGIVQYTVCRETGTIAGDNCPTRVSEIAWQQQPPPPPEQGFVQTIAVDSWTGLRANQWCQENVEQETFSNIRDPFAVEWLNNTSRGQQFAQRIGLPLPLQTPPNDACFQGQVLPTVRLNNPTSGQQVQNELTITGQVSAQDGNFNRYELEYASSNTPNNFIQISSSTTQAPNAGSTLGTWDTRSVPNGQYILRLAAYSNAGGNIIRDVPIIIQNVEPTATPTVTPSPTQLIPPTSMFPQVPTASGGGTLIPFDPVNPTPTATLAF